MLRGYLKNAGLTAPPLLDWAHLARRVQVAKTTAKRLRCGTTEGLVNNLVNQRMNKLQQMRWSAAGVHAVVVVRAYHINATNFSPLNKGKAA